MPEDFATRGTDIAKLESSVKNKFKWAWLEEKDGGGEFLSNYVRKLNSPGLAYCLHCKQRLDYSKKGKLAIKRHADSANHKKNAKAVRQTQSLPTIFKGLASLESGEKTVPSAIPYGAAPNVPDCAASFSSTDISSKQVPVDPCPSFKDRVAHQEAMICSFIAEHSLPLSLAPSLIKLAQSLSIDHKALESLSMERQTMTYKMKHGLHEVERKRLIKQLQSTPFSINVDESTAKHNKKRVLNVLVCFFDKNLGKSVTHLYAAIELTVVNASTVYTAVKSKLESDAIPLDNLISCLSDSAAYMRGSESGFQARLKTDAPHLLDIDGDICHHIHNISKHFCQKLDPSNHLAHLLDDIHRDFMFSPDIREDFTSICKILGVKCQQPKERVGHRWLSMLDSSIPLHELMDPLTVMYYAWLTHSDKELYKDTYTAILKEKCVSPAGRQTIMEILRKLRGKTMTQLGKQRKARIYSKLFDKRKETDLVLSCMLSVLPMFNSLCPKSPALTSMPSPEQCLTRQKNGPLCRVMSRK